MIGDMTELRRVAGHPDQVYGSRLVRVVDGPGDGMRVLEVWNAVGLRAEIMVDRGFDLHRVEHRGSALQWTGPPGLRSRFAFEPQEWGWLRNFHGGLVMTCGLEHVLLPRDRPTPEYQLPVEVPVHFGLHGRVANEGASLVAHEIIEDGSEPRIRVRGRVVQASLFRENLWLERTYEISLFEPVIWLRDAVLNVGHCSTHHELLYHINLGYPLVDEGTAVHVPGEAEPIVATGPQPGFTEVVTHHEVPVGADGTAVVEVQGGGHALALAYRPTELPHFYVWYMMGEGTYAIGLEPSTQIRDRSLGDLEAESFLAPGERRTYELGFTIGESPR